MMWDLTNYIILFVVNIVVILFYVVILAVVVLGVLIALLKVNRRIDELVLRPFRRSKE